MLCGVHGLLSNTAKLLQTVLLSRPDQDQLHFCFLMMSGHDIGTEDATTTRKALPRDSIDVTGFDWQLEAR